MGSVVDWRRRSIDSLTDTKMNDRYDVNSNGKTEFQDQDEEMTDRDEENQDADRPSRDLVCKIKADSEEGSRCKSRKNDTGNFGAAGLIECTDQRPAKDTHKKDRFPFLNLPREIRDKIHESVVTLDSPLSDRKFRFKCTSEYCAAKLKADNTTSRAQFRQIRYYSTVCKQVHKEVVEVFFRVNSWDLHRPRLRDDPAEHPRALVVDARRMFRSLNERALMKHFKHLNMQICISPLAYVDLSTLTEFLNTDPVEFLHYQMLRNPDRLRKHTLGEEAQCEMFRQALKCLAECHRIVFPKLQTLTLELSLHSPQRRSFKKDALDRCGITFTVKIRLDTQRSAPPIMPVSTRLRSSQNHAISNFDTSNLEPTRRMLSPLTGLSGVQTVEVERRWIVLHRPDGGDGKVHLTIHDDGTVEEEGLLASHMAQHHKFCSVEEMLAAGKENFALFQATGLKAHGIHLDNVVEIYENEGQASACVFDLEP